MPDVQSQAPSNLEMGTQNRFCSGENADNSPTSCKFLLPLTIAERGLNAHVHLMQLLKPTQAFNRTLTLPDVGNNRVGACRRWRFGIYYDERALLSKLDGGNYDCASRWVQNVGRFSRIFSLVATRFCGLGLSLNFPLFSMGERFCSRVRCFLCLRVTSLPRSTSNEIVFN